jgi:hypothetical protein
MTHELLLASMEPHPFVGDAGATGSERPSRAIDMLTVSSHRQSPYLKYGDRCSHRELHV